MTDLTANSGIAPLQKAERIGELDVLRGFALLGVFVVHFVSAAFFLLPLDEELASRWQADPIQRSALLFSDVFFLDKANTLFAVLFGIGFWVMMERLQARGGNFERIYTRRLVGLLLIGAVNLFLIFPGDVLHEYALIGFVLFALRGLQVRTLLIIGLPLALVASPIIGAWLPGLGDAEPPFHEVQQDAFANGGYWNWVVLTSVAHVNQDLIKGGALAWALYILGRFLIGAWVIRQGWLQRAGDLLPNMRRQLIWVLPLGLGLEFLTMLLYEEFVIGPAWLTDLAHVLGVPLTALGYAMILILLFHSDRYRWTVLSFAPVGRIALTAYVLHCFVFTLLFFPFGFDLLGKVPPATSLAIAVSLYAAITLFSRVWLGRYRYGPLEYLWRWATYGSRPPLLRSPGMSTS